MKKHQTNQHEELYQHTSRQKDSTIKLRVNAKITGKPRFRIGVWLIKLGVILAQVHVRVWIDEDRPHGR